MNTTPPNGAPKLPPMSPAERELWMLSHRAPEGMIMVHQNEIAQVQRHVFGLSTERNLLIKALGALYKQGESPITTIHRLLEQLRKAMERIKELEGTP
jgi:hypothetical protein